MSRLCKKDHLYTPQIHWYGRTSSFILTLTQLQNNGKAPSSLVSVNLAKMKNISVSEKKTHLEVILNTASVAFAGRFHSVFLAEHLILRLG